MCNKCLVRSRSIEIINLESRINILFNKIEANPADYKDDANLIRLMDKLADLIDKYKASHGS